MTIEIALQDAVYVALKNLADGSVFYSVPDNAQLPYIYFGDDDILRDYDNGGNFIDATANIEVFASDKAALKELVGKVVEALDAKLEIAGFDVFEWRVGVVSFRTMQDGLTEQASLEFDYLIQSAD